MTVPAELYASFTMNGSIPVVYNYEIPAPLPPSVFTAKQIQEFIVMAKSKRPLSPTDPYIYQAIERHSVKDKHVAVLDSVSPWYESILLAYGAHPTTISSRVTSEDQRVNVEAIPSKLFDAIFSISHLKQAGLGRNNEPLNPNADFEAIAKMKTYLKRDGLLYLSIPVGKNCLVWNSHRIYGESRLKTLLKGWRIIGYFGFTFEDLLKEGSLNHQPVIVIKPIS